MNALLDSLRESFATARTSMCGDSTKIAERESILEAALKTGLPAARNEAWKYT